MKLDTNVPLSSLTTLRVGGLTREVITIEKASDIPAAIEHSRVTGLPWNVIGGGSNTLATDAPLEHCILHMKNRGIEIIEEDSDALTARVQAGEPWDAFISWVLEHNLWGAENLAGIPGTVGAAPVQNVGAYGTEVSMFIIGVSAFDTILNTFVDLSHDACQFGYRDSIFKSPEGGRFIVASVTVRLSKHAQPALSYKDLAERFATTDQSTLKPRNIAQAVIEIRSKKFPDLKQVGTAGSFFKNPVISKEAFERLQKMFPEVPSYPVTEEDRIKIPVAWILDHVLGMRGYKIGTVGFFEQHALVLVAYDGATAHDIDVFAKDVAQRVHDATNIVIEREVRELK